MFITVHPPGQFPYAANPGADAISLCTLNPMPGAFR